ncbi:MAG: hypothetical protein ACRDPA_27665 [Solirubrobacteraceae bacterium]
MSNIEDTLWDHLVEHHQADRARVRPATRSRPHKRPVAIGMASTGLAAAVAATVLLVSASTNTPPAYALAAQANGSYTLTINDLVAAIPQVNAEFAKRGINAKAVPVTAGCPSQDPFPGPGPLSMSQSITIDNADIPAGTTALIAAEPTSSGVRLSMGTTAASPLPSCFNSNAPAPAVTSGN